MRLTYELRGKLWRYPGAGGWHFVTLPARAAREIREVFGHGSGWGAVRVRATIGATSWETSIFPDKKSASYLLPVKADVRKAEKVAEGGAVVYHLELGR